MWGGISLWVFLDFAYLFLERGEGKEKERNRNINVWLLLYAPNWGPGLQPRHVPWLGIELAPICFAGRHSVLWATPARGHCVFNLQFSAEQWCWAPFFVINIYLEKTILPIFNWLFVYYWFVRVLYIFWIQSPKPDIWFANIYSSVWQLKKKSQWCLLKGNTF